MRLLYQALSGHATSRAAAARMFAFFLGATFLTEFLVMGMIPVLCPPSAPKWLTALLDAASLTAILGPLVWWVFIRPMHRLHLARGRLLERLMASQEDERRRIAIDLHDGLGQQLTSILLRARVLEQTAHDATVAQAASSVREIAAASLDDIRRVVRQTRPMVLDDIGLEAAIERQVADVGEAGGVAIRLEWRALPGLRWSQETETALYRIIQEALTNAAKHANADHVRIVVEKLENAISVSVTDDGVGFDVAKVLDGSPRPFGLLNIRERVAHVGGVATIRSAPGVGTTVSVTIPLDSERGS